MRIDAALKALRGDPSLQRIAQECMEEAKQAFLQTIARNGIARDLERYGEGADLDRCESLAAWFGETGAGSEAVSALMQPMLAAMRKFSLGYVPFRHQYSDGFGVLQLLRSGRATVSLALIEGAPLHDRSAAQTVSFSDVERHELVLSGEASVQIVRLDAVGSAHGELTCETRNISPGEVLSFAPMRESKVILRLDRHLLILRLSREAKRPEPSCEYRLSDGALVHRASGSLAESRQEMMLATLGRMRRHDAAPLMAEMAREGSEHLRWNALRECLALDSAQGFAELSRVAAAKSDPLSAPANALCEELLVTYPALAKVRAEPCPA